MTEEKLPIRELWTVISELTTEVAVIKRDIHWVKRIVEWMIVGIAAILGVQIPLWL